MFTHEETVESISKKLLGLDSGPLAELRRLEPNEAGTPMFWRMAAEYGFSDVELGAWKQIVRIMALLTPRGDRSNEVRLHERTRSLGAVLCDGGDPGWPPKGADAAPVLSEKRLARFLATPADQRGESLERIARMLARSRSPKSGVNCTEIAHLLLYPDKTKHLEDVARYYYSRLDRAAYQSKNEEGTV
jgi:CRISPR system Cascade subunit CasB